MMIVRCPDCASRFKAPENMAGQTVRCAKCKIAFTVPPVEAELEVVEEITEVPRTASPWRRRGRPPIPPRAARR